MENPLRGTLSFQKIEKEYRKSRKSMAVSGLVDSAKSLLLSALSGKNWLLLICADESRGKRLYRDIRSFTEHSWFYPAKDLLFYQADTRGTVLLRRRVEVLKHLSEDREGIVVTTMDALMDKIKKREHFVQSVLKLVPGQSIELEELSGKLSALGYRRLPEITAMGEYSVRGGIVDVYPFTEENPVRIEFWDREIDDIRSFSVASQRSLESLSELSIFPAGDTAERKEEVSLLEYFPEETLFVLDEPMRLKERGELVEEEFRESFLRRKREAEKHEKLQVQLAVQGIDLAHTNVTTLIYDTREILGRLRGRRTMQLSSLGTTFFSGEEKIESLCFSMDTAEMQSYRKSFESLRRDLGNWQKEGFTVVLYSPSRTRASRLAQTLRDYGIRAYCPDETEDGKRSGTETEPTDAPQASAAFSSAVIKPEERTEGAEGLFELRRRIQEEKCGAAEVRFGVIHSGFLYRAEKLAILSEGDMFGNAEKARKKKRNNQNGGIRIGRLSELSVGDYVVHESHGIGIYRGIERISSPEQITKDYITIEYGDGGRLYLPATRLDSIQKYGSSEAKKPKLNKLNGTEWQRTRSRVESSVREMAKELVSLYAARQNAGGYRFSQDTVWQKEFEELFPYEETADQLLAIDTVKNDMESRKIMDRLVCGDVGYGKTEIALRAAFKAVQDSKQVAYLVPTTILAQQIYNTFTERMKGFPVKIALLCRFRSPKQIRESIKELETGRVDIVIGTHRLLSKDVRYRDLGLLIIDEEQRFGVSHKERIKQLKQNVDVLTLTATPIPRTLHMSMAGIRDMSILEEPPMDRVPVQTYVMEYNDELVREAVGRELSRSGQVYYVHNRVNNIADIAAHLGRLLPDVRIAYAHGQMSESELETIMLSFIHGEIDVLVSTTIIETGLDIPNANTLIVDDADRMGLSQLYQLRGRVGRSNRMAYAFLMYHRGKLLTEESEKRLKAIKEFTELGSGIRIAMRDLEIRGAGNVLGAEQHGHMEAVGYELYCKLLNHAVKTEQGELAEQDSFETQIDCDLDAYLPDTYISFESQKLDMYQRIASIQNEEEAMDMEDELIDRFGELPVQAENLLRIVRLRVLAHQCCVTELELKKGCYKLLFLPDADIRVEQIPELVTLCNGQLRFTQGQTPMMSFRKRRPGTALSGKLRLREDSVQTGKKEQESWSLEETMEQLRWVLEHLRKQDVPEKGNETDLSGRKKPQEKDEGENTA